MARRLAPVRFPRVRPRIDAPPLVGLKARGPRSVPLCRVFTQWPLRLASSGRPGRFPTLYPPGPVSHHRLPRLQFRSAWQAAPSLSSCARAFTLERNSWSGQMDPDTDSFALLGSSRSASLLARPCRSDHPDARRVADLLRSVRLLPGRERFAGTVRVSRTPQCGGRFSALRLRRGRAAP